MLCVSVGVKILLHDDKDRLRIVSYLRLKSKFVETVRNSEPVQSKFSLVQFSSFVMM